MSGLTTTTCLFEKKVLTQVKTYDIINLSNKRRILNMVPYKDRVFLEDVVEKCYEINKQLDALNTGVSYEVCFGQKVKRGAHPVDEIPVELRVSTPDGKGCHIITPIGQYGTLRNARPKKMMDDLIKYSSKYLTLIV